MTIELSSIIGGLPINVAIIIQPTELSFPTRPVDFFGRPGPYVVEIGFGNGDFLCDLARMHPEWNILGADTSPSSVVRAYRRIKRQGLSNVKLFAGDGRFIVRNVVPDGELDRVYVNFPDPWPRRRHHHRRLLSGAFFELLAGRLAAEGHLFLTTDHEDYYRFARRKAEATELYAVDVDSAPPETLATRWARRWMEQGRSIYHARFRKKTEPESPSTRISITEMQHSLLRGSLATITDLDKFVVTHEGVNVVVTEAFRRIGQDDIVFPVIVEEDGLRQFVLVEACPRDDEVLVGVKRFGHPLSTRGVNMAVTAVADFLERQGLEMVERTY